MLEKNIILIVLGVVAASIAYLGYAVYKNYPETITKPTPEGAEG